MKVLILGASGFIGSHLTERLLSEGLNVIGIDIHNDKIKELLDHKRFIFIQQDIRSKNWNLDALVKDSDLVIDLIAYANPALYITMPLDVFQLNFIENFKIVQSCVQHNKRLIQFSSSEVYGKTPAAITDGNLANKEDPVFATFSEDKSSFILGPVEKHRWIYACAKQLLERVIHAYGIETNFNYSIIRPFNFLGPKIDYLLNEIDGIPRVFSLFMDALINGTEMKLVDGGYSRRCYTYIDDAIECAYRIIMNPKGVCDQQIFNIGSPQNEVSIRELANVMLEIYSEKFKRPNTPLPKIIEISGEDFYGVGYEDSDRRIPDISKARNLLGWEPKWGFREMLEATIEYYVEEYPEQDQKMKNDGRFIHQIPTRTRSSDLL